MTPEGRVVAKTHGRQYIEKDKSYIFIELISELEVQVLSNQKALGSFTTNGISVSGEQAIMAIRNLTDSVRNSTGSLLRSIELAQKRLSILKGQYYDYALKKYIELSFGSVATDVFTEYRTSVDNGFSSLSKETLLKLQAIEDSISSGNIEHYSQALTTCRRLFECTANELFARWLPNYTDAKYKTKSGAEIDISGEHTKTNYQLSLKCWKTKRLRIA